MERCVEPEMLDRLPAADPEAIRSRSDLRRVNRLMGHAGIIRRALVRVVGKNLRTAGRHRHAQIGVRIL